MGDLVGGSNDFGAEQEVLFLPASQYFIDSMTIVEKGKTFCFATGEIKDAPESCQAGWFCPDKNLLYDDYYVLMLSSQGQNQACPYPAQPPSP